MTGGVKSDMLYRLQTADSIIVLLSGIGRMMIARSCSIGSIALWQPYCPTSIPCVGTFAQLSTRGLGYRVSAYIWRGNDKEVPPKGWVCAL